MVVSWPKSIGDCPKTRISDLKAKGLDPRLLSGCPGTCAVKRRFTPIYGGWLSSDIQPVCRTSRSAENLSPDEGAPVVEPCPLALRDPGRC